MHLAPNLWGNKQRPLGARGCNDVCYPGGALHSTLCQPLVLNVFQTCFTSRRVKWQVKLKAVPATSHSHKSNFDWACKLIAPTPYECFVRNLNDAISTSVQFDLVSFTLRDTYLLTTQMRNLDEFQYLELLATIVNKYR